MRRHLTICLAFQRGTGHASRTATRLATHADLLAAMSNTAADIAVTLQALTREVALHPV